MGPVTFLVFNYNFGPSSIGKPSLRVPWKTWPILNSRLVPCLFSPSNYHCKLQAFKKHKHAVQTSHKTCVAYSRILSIYLSFYLSIYLSIGIFFYICTHTCRIDFFLALIQPSQKRWKGKSSSNQQGSILPSFLAMTIWGVPKKLVVITPNHRFQLGIFHYKSIFIGFSQGFHRIFMRFSGFHRIFRCKKPPSAGYRPSHWGTAPESFRWPKRGHSSVQPLLPSLKDGFLESRRSGLHQIFSDVHKKGGKHPSNISQKSMVMSKWI